MYSFLMLIIKLFLPSILLDNVLDRLLCQESRISASAPVLLLQPQPSILSLIHDLKWEWYCSVLCGLPQTLFRHKETPYHWRRNTHQKGSGTLLRWLSWASYWCTPNLSVVEHQALGVLSFSRQHWVLFQSLFALFALRQWPSLGRWPSLGHWHGLPRTWTFAVPFTGTLLSPIVIRLLGLK